MSDKGMANCFCGSPLILIRNTENEGATVEHIKDPNKILEVRDYKNPMDKMVAWLEEIHGLHPKG